MPMRLIRRMLTWLVTGVVVAYAALCVLLFTQQRAMLFPAPKVRVDSPVLKRVDVPGGSFLVWNDAGPQAPVVVHFHGNAEQVGALDGFAQLYASKGLSFVAVEFPGYAGTPGQPSEDSLLEAGRKAMEHLAGPMGISRDRLILSAQSIGTGVATRLASEGWGQKVLLLTPYTSLPDVAARVLPWLPVRLLMRDRFDNAALAPTVKVPVLIIHGTRDEVIPFDLGQTLSTRFPSARFLAIDGAHHNDLWDSPLVVDAVLNFVAP